MDQASSRVLTAGIDVGAGAVKVVITTSHEGDEGKVVARAVERIRRRNVYELARRLFDDTCAQNGVALRDLAYVASTGDGEASESFSTGHFYSMTTHASRARARRSTWARFTRAPSRRTSAARCSTTA
jgi:activator of 2-hydroxyglutaryl-CoA dehydratase